MRIPAFLFLAASVCCATTSAIAAQGIVVDPSGRPVRGARVECGGDSAITDVEGHFRLTSERCSATISAPGFEAARIELNADTARVQLALAALTEEVVVSATRRETTVEEAGVAATVYTRSDLEASQAPQLADVLQNTPGLTIVRYGRPGSLTQMFARGGQRTGTLVMIDGVPVNDPGGEINLAGFSTNGLDRVEVVRGPESALFGAEASSGVIQLFTARGNPEERLPRGSATYERGSFQTDRFAANLAGGSGSRLDYALSAEQFHTVGEYQNDYFRNTNGTANVGLRLGASSQVRGIFRAFDSMLGAPNQVAYGIQDLDANEATRDYLTAVRLDDVRGRNYVQRLSFGYHRSWDLFTDTNADGPFEIAALVRDGNRRVYLDRLLSSIPDTIPPGTRLETRAVELWASDPFLSLTSRKNLDYQGTLTHTGGAAVFGYEFERQRGDITGRDISRDNHGIFLHEQRAIASRLFLSGGVRMEQNSAFGKKITPRGAASLRLAPSTFVRFSAGIGITEPSLLQNFARDPYFIGNPNLRPEKTTSYEAGIVREWFGRKLRTEASAFHNSFRDLIVFVFLPWPEPSTWQNVEASRAHGVEFTAEGRIVPGLTASGNYTRLWSRITKSSSPNSLFTGVGQELPRRPGNSAAASLLYARGRFSAHAGALLIGERQDTNVFGVTRNSGYQNVYAGASMRVAAHLNPFVRVNNLLDQRYQEILGYPAQSRAVNGGLRVEW